MAGVLLGIFFVAMVSGCGASVSSYVKPDAPWSAVRRVAVVPFELTSENPVQRQLTTQLFSEELRKADVVDVIDVPLSSPVGSGVEEIGQVAKTYKVDAVVSGSVDETYGTVIHVRIHDVATEELLWSGTFLLGTRAEFFSLRTQQQQFRRGFSRLVSKFVDQTYGGTK
jgi:TolB-like protein